MRPYKIGHKKYTPPPKCIDRSCPNSMNFMQFLGKNWPNNSFPYPPLELAPPPRGNPRSATEMCFWTCFCLVSPQYSTVRVWYLNIAEPGLLVTGVLRYVVTVSESQPRVMSLKSLKYADNGLLNRKWVTGSNVGANPLQSKTLS